MASISSGDSAFARLFGFESSKPGATDRREPVHSAGAYGGGGGRASAGEAFPDYLARAASGGVDRNPRAEDANARAEEKKRRREEHRERKDSDGFEPGANAAAEKAAGPGSTGGTERANGAGNAEHPGGRADGSAAADAGATDSSASGSSAGTNGAAEPAAAAAAGASAAPLSSSSSSPAGRASSSVSSASVSASASGPSSAFAQTSTEALRASAGASATTSGGADARPAMQGAAGSGLPLDGKMLPSGLAGSNGAAAVALHGGGSWGGDAGLLLAHGASSVPHGAAAGAQAAGLVTVAGAAAGIDGGAAAQGQAASPALPAPPGPGFDQGLAQRLVWMVQHGFRDARLHLHPEHLGAVDVHLRLDDAAAQVTLSSPHAMVREAMTQAVPQLRDLLGGAGLMLTHVNVDAGQGRESGSFGAHAGSEAGAAADRAAVSAGDESGAGAALRLPAGLVDLFA